MRNSLQSKARVIWLASVKHDATVQKVLQLNLIRKCDFQTFQEVCLFLVWKFELFNKIERNRVDPRFYELGF